MASDAVGLERVGKVVGYKITKGNFSEVTPNLPQRVAIFGEANTANQLTMDLNAKEITSAQQAGEEYGYGSPIHIMMRILRPVFGGGIGGIPVIVYPQVSTGAAAKELEITPTGSATGNGTHTLVVAGRRGIDGVNYDINILQGDTPAIISQKITDAFNNVLGCPFSAVASVTESTATSKWQGKTANALSVTVDNNGDDLGVTYAVVSTQSGAGTPGVGAALLTFGNDWNTLVLNSYGTETSVMDALEAFNGIPDPDSPTGRYTGIIMKPFVAITGSVLEDPSAITDPRKSNVTIAIAPAPLSAGLAMEAAANMTLLEARTAQDNPHLDVSSKSYPDMPAASAIGAMSNYDNRDAIVKKGCSTVDLNNGVYVVQDFVTTYHPVGELPPQFRYVRNLVIDFNIRFGYYLLEAINVIDHAIVADNDIVSAQKTIKPKQWKQQMATYFIGLSSRALIVTPQFSADGLIVNISTTNPDRLETFFPYKRSGYVRIASTTVQAGFNFGSIN